MLTNLVDIVSRIFTDAETGESLSISEMCPNGQWILIGWFVGHSSSQIFCISSISIFPKFLTLSEICFRLSLITKAPNLPSVDMSHSVI